MAVFFLVTWSFLSHAFSWQAVKCDKIIIPKDNAVENQSFSVSSPAWRRTGDSEVLWFGSYLRKLNGPHAKWRVVPYFIINKSVESSYVLFYIRASLDRTNCSRVDYDSICGIFYTFVLLQRFVVVSTDCSASHLHMLNAVNVTVNIFTLLFFFPSIFARSSSRPQPTSLMTHTVEERV